MSDNIFSDVTINLFEKLRTIYDDRNFIIGILSYADNDEDRQTVLDFINNGNEVTTETVSVLALELSNKRKSFI